MACAWRFRQPARRTRPARVWRAGTRAALARTMQARSSSTAT